MPQQPAQIVVFGSVNMDLVVRSPRLPQPGETLMGHDFVTTPGGKGANQAVAAARLGLTTAMVGRVGADAFGPELLASLECYGVDTANVLVDQQNHSGIAVIILGDRGENQILGVLGANGRLDQTDIARLGDQLSGAQLLLLQLEVDLDAVIAAARMARAQGVTLMLDPAPVPPQGLAPLYPLVDILLPNQVEAAQLVGFPVDDPASAASAAIALQAQGVPTVIIKLAEQGAYYHSPTESGWVPAFSVDAVDTVAAGDAFAGGFAAAWCEGHPLPEAVRWGCAAGALATTKQGAQIAMGDRASLNKLLQQNRP